MFNLFKSNYVRIAENTTKYYLELKSHFSNMFKDDMSLISTAGVLAAQNYVFKDQLLLGVEDIVTHMGNIKNSFIELKPILNKDSTNSLSGEEGTQFVLISLIKWLECRIFIVDNPKIPPEYIFEAVERKSNLIERTVYKTLQKYRGETLLRQAIIVF